MGGRSTRDPERGALRCQAQAVPSRRMPPSQPVLLSNSPSKGCWVRFRRRALPLIQHNKALQLAGAEKARRTDSTLQTYDAVRQSLFAFHRAVNLCIFSLSQQQTILCHPVSHPPCAHGVRTQRTASSSSTYSRHPVAPQAPGLTSRNKLQSSSVKPSNADPRPDTNSAPR